MQTYLYLKIIFIQVLPPWESTSVTMEKEKKKKKQQLTVKPAFQDWNHTLSPYFSPNLSSSVLSSHGFDATIFYQPQLFAKSCQLCLHVPLAYALLLYIWRPSCPVSSAADRSHGQSRRLLLPSIYSALQLANLPTAPFPPSDGFLLWGSKAEQPMKPCLVHPQHLSSFSTY